MSKIDDNIKTHDLMRKFDRESNTRIWTGWRKKAVSIICTVFSIFCIYMTLFSTMLPERKLSLFVAFVVFLGYLNYPLSRHQVKENNFSIIDIFLISIGTFCFIYFAIAAPEIIRVGTRISVFQIIVGLFGIITILELARRCVGLPIVCVAAVLLLYTFITLMSRGSLFITLRTISNRLFYTTSGIIGTPINVCYTYIVLFIIFGAFLEKTGIANFFISIANKIAGRSSGGPAKVAVISSALCGMVSGSSVGNTVTTGSVTIPMMKDTGYSPEFSAAVEASSSTGGQIMPPIMGAAAFLMAEYMGVPYSVVALKAILPAVLYFVGILLAVHLEAKKLGLKGVDNSKIVKTTEILKKLYLLFPLVLLVVLVTTGVRTMQFSAAISIFVAIIVGFINRDNRLNLNKIFNALSTGATGAVTVSVACAVAGIIAGCITITGLASILINGILSISGSTKIIGLLLTMICCIVLGMGVPTTANYCIMASTCAPILIKMGIPVIPSHFFVFYFGIVADITPPVALAAYAGSAIAKSNPLKTGFTATRLAIAAFIVPFVFAYNPSLLFENVNNIFSVIQIIITSVCGIYAIAAGTSGFTFIKLGLIKKILYIISGLILIIPENISDIIGLVLLLSLSIFDYLKFRKEKKQLK